MIESTSIRVPWTERIRELRNRKFVRDAFGLSVGKALNLTMGVLSTLIFGIVFAKTEIAVISLFDMFVQLILAFGVTWSGVGITRFGKHELKVSKSLCYTSSTRLHIVTPVVVMAVLLLVAFRTSVLEYLGTNQPILIWYMIGILLVMTIHDQLTTILATREKHLANAMYHVAEGAAKLLILGTFLSGLVDANVLWYLSTSFWLSVVILIFRLPACGRSFLYPVCRVSREDLQTFLRYVVPQLYGFAGIYVVNWVDVYFIRKHGTMEVLGEYQFMYSIFLKIASFAFVANGLLFPRIMAWKLENPAQITRFARTAPQAMLLVTMFACGFLLVIFPPVFDVFFGDKYSTAYPAFTLLVCSLPCFFICQVFNPLLNSFDRVKYIQNVNIISAVCNLIVDFLLVPKHGIIGAALGTFVAYWVKAILLMFPVHTLLGVRWRLISVLLAALAAFAGTRYLSALSIGPFDMLSVTDLVNLKMITG